MLQQNGAHDVGVVYCVIGMTFVWVVAWASTSTSDQVQGHIYCEVADKSDT